MTFIVSHNGKVYEKNLGKDSAAIGAKMTTFDPGAGMEGSGALRAHEGPMLAGTTRPI